MKSDTIRQKLKITNWLLEAILLIIFIFFSITANNFFSIGNTLNILRSISFKGIIACFMTMIIIAGEMDLSVGSTVAFAGVFTAYLNKAFMGLGLDATAGTIIAIAIVVLAAAIVGYLISLFVTRLKVPSFIVTLAAMQLMRGAALILANGFPIQGYPSWFKYLGSGYVGPIPFPAVIFALFIAATWYVMTNTPFGRSIYAIGSNPDSAALSGIDVNKIKQIIFMLTSAAAGLVGIMVSAQLNSGSPNIGTNYEMDVISSVIIGGASLSGGAGTIRGTLIGCIFTGIILNAMTLLGVSDYWQYVVRGSLVVFAVFLNTMVKERLKERGL